MFFRKSRSEKYFKKGVRKISFKDYLGAIDDFSKAINLSPENNRAYFERAKAKKAINDYQGAVDDFSKEINLNPRNWIAYYQRAKAKKKLEVHQGAIDDFLKAIELNPRNSLNFQINSDLQEMKNLFYKSENYERANKENNFIKALNIQRAISKSKYACNNEFKNFNEVYRNCSRVVKIFNESIGFLSTELVSKDRSILINSENLKENNIFDDEIILKRALKKVDLNCIYSALADYSRIIVNNSSNEKVFLYKGEAKEALNDYEGAINEYSKLIEINPNNQNAYIFRGKAKVKSRDYINSLYSNPFSKNMLDKSNEDNSKESIKDLKNAINDFSKVIEINPKNENALIERGQTKTKCKDYEGAIQDYSNALEINPRNYMALFRRGNVKEKLVDYNGAIQDYSEAQKLEPNRRFIQVCLNRAKKESKDPKYSSEDLKPQFRLSLSELLNENTIDQYSKSIQFISDIKNEKDFKTLSGLILKDCPESINLIKDAITNFIEVIDHSIDWIDSNPSENFELSIQEENDSVFERLYKTENSSNEDEKITQLNADGDKKFELQDYQGAIDDYSEALKLFPENKEALKKRSEAYQKLSEIDLDKSKDLDD